LKLISLGEGLMSQIVVWVIQANKNHSSINYNRIGKIIRKLILKYFSFRIVSNSPPYPIVKTLMWL